MCMADEEAKSDFDRLSGLVRAWHPLVWVSTLDESYARELVFEAAQRAGRRVWTWSSVQGVVRPVEDRGGGAVPKTEGAVEGLYELLTSVRTPGGQGGGLLVLFDVVGHLEDARTLRLLRELVEEARQREGCVVMVDHAPELPAALSGVATTFRPSLPDEKELEDLVLSTLRRLNRRSPIELDMRRSELKTIIKNLRGLTRRQAEQVVIDSAIDDKRFDIRSLNAVMALKRQAVSSGGLLEYVKSPVDLSRVGGMGVLKRWLADRERSFDEDAAAFGLKPPRGVLLLGVQGAGKSLCAKAIATAWSRPILRMDVGALYDKYIGESERRLREALRQAEGMAPIVLWIDEIEKAFASASSASNDGGLSRRMFGALLTWMQEHREPVFLVATANDVAALPPELLRKGRFDEIFFVDLPGAAAREEIFKVHLGKRGRDPSGFNLSELVAASEGFSGAEIEQAVLASLHSAFAAGRDIGTGDVVGALKASPPLSVTMRERVEELRSWARGRCVWAE